MNNSQKLKSLAASAGVLGSLTGAAVAEADVTTVTGLQPGEKFHLVFVSRSSMNAVTNNPASYDALVAADAAAAGLGSYAGNSVTWQTLGSFKGGPSAVGRFNPTAPVYTLDGVKVAANGADLWDGIIQSPINVAPDLTLHDTRVWTGSDGGGNNAFGTKNLDISIGANTLQGSEFGQSGSTNITWMAAASNDDSAQYRLYAFSNELTVAAVPESTWIGALAGAALGLVAWFRTR